MVWSLALCPDDTKQDPVVYGTEFSVVFLAKGPRTTPILKRASGASAFITYSGLEKEHGFRLVVALP